MRFLGKDIRKRGKMEFIEGDICLHDRKDLTQYALLKLSTKYILFHGTRVSV